MFRFKIRHLLWLTLIVALVLGWGLSRKSDVERSLTADQRGYIHCAVSYLDRHGGPSYSAVKPDSLAEWQAHGAACLEWLQTLPRAERIELEQGFREFRQNYSPYYPD